MIDTTLSFKGCVGYAGEKPRKEISSLAEIIPELLAAYRRGDEIYFVIRGSYLEEGIGQCYEAELTGSGIRPIALRMRSAYRTTSVETEYPIAGMISFDLLSNKAHCLS